MALSRQGYRRRRQASQVIQLQMENLSQLRPCLQHPVAVRTWPRRLLLLAGAVNSLAALSLQCQCQPQSQRRRVPARQREQRLLWLHLMQHPSGETPRSSTLRRSSPPMMQPALVLAMEAMETEMRRFVCFRQRRAS
jgi:hypothetical protein